MHSRRPLATIVNPARSSAGDRSQLGDDVLAIATRLDHYPPAQTTHPGADPTQRAEAISVAGTALRRTSTTVSISASARSGENRPSM